MEIDNQQRIRNNITQIMRKIETAAEKSGRSAKDVKIIAVTKYIDPILMDLVLKIGISTFAENRVQEIIKKYDIFLKQVDWHFIGRLQTNKVKYLIDKITMIHSMDRLDLAVEVDKQARAHGIVMDVLVQVNISGEETKTGVEKKALFEFLEKVSKLPNIKVRGLMTMAPFYENQDAARWIFRELKKISIDIKKENYDNVNMDYFSMGMSNDFEVAIEEGANIVRLGSAIFN